jgi:hypothetical protein
LATETYLDRQEPEELREIAQRIDPNAEVLEESVDIDGCDGWKLTVRGPGIPSLETRCVDRTRGRRLVATSLVELLGERGMLDAEEFSVLPGPGLSQGTVNRRVRGIVGRSGSGGHLRRHHAADGARLAASDLCRTLTCRPLAACNDDCDCKQNRSETGDGHGGFLRSERIEDASHAEIRRFNLMTWGTGQTWTHRQQAVQPSALTTYACLLP